MIFFSNLDLKLIFIQIILITSSVYTFQYQKYQCTLILNFSI